MTEKRFHQSVKDDTEGYIFWLHLVVPAAVIGTGAVLIGREVSKGVEPLPPPNVGSLPTGAPQTINVGGHQVPIQ